MWEHVTVLEENGQVATCGRLGKKFGKKLHDDADEREIAVAVEEMEKAIHDVGEEGGTATDRKRVDVRMLLCKERTQRIDQRGTRLDGIFGILLKHGIELSEKVLHLLRFPFHIERIEFISDSKERSLHLIHLPRYFQAMVASKLQFTTTRRDVVP